ncbi:MULTISPECIES: hypothetical protein [unclassified Dysgonomonas]|uniref:hypothetical protein n=1 Tax=unclassified Dysgonomonas TaxID=2630389 RepID=UPI002476F859|nr:MULTISPECIES: hypothetical protein [unclassified Dysgonomonas]
MDFIKIHWRPLIINLLYLLPALLIASYLGVNQISHALSDPYSFDGYSNMMIGGVFIANIIYYITYFVAILFTVSYIAECTFASDGRTINTKDVWRRVGSSFFRTLGAGFLAGIATVLGAMLCIIPGVFVGVCFSLYAYYCIIDEESAVSSLTSSYDVVKSQWFPTFGYMIVLGIIGYMVNMIFSIPAGLTTFGLFLGGADMYISVFSNPIFITITNFISYSGMIVVVPFIQIAMSFQYFNLKEIETGTGIEREIEMIGKRNENDYKSY